MKAEVRAIVAGLLKIETPYLLLLYSNTLTKNYPRMAAAGGRVNVWVWNEVTTVGTTRVLMTVVVIGLGHVLSKRIFENFFQKFEITCKAEMVNL